MSAPSSLGCGKVAERRRQSRDRPGVGVRRRGGIAHDDGRPTVRFIREAVFTDGETAALLLLIVMINARNTLSVTSRAWRAELPADRVGA
jgi:hypothetical protein